MSIVLLGSTSGSVTLQEPAVAGSTVVTLPTVSMNMGTGGGSVATNTAFGASALAANTTGYSNSAFGSSALLANTDGYRNNAFGKAALTSNTTGNTNNAFGEFSLNSNTSGASNVSMGHQSLYSNTTGIQNTAVGYQAGYTNQTGSYNTFLGVQAGYTSNVANANNTCVGAASGYSLTTGTTNTFIGANSTVGASGYYVTSGSKNTILGGYNGNQGSLDIRTASNYIVLSDGDGNPRGIFDNFGGFMVGGSVDQTNAGFGIAFNSPAYLGDNYGRMVVKKTFSGSVTGVAFLHNNGAVGTISYSNSATAYNTSSDYRLKNTIAPMTGALAKVAQLKPVTYKWNIDNSNSEGFIAHELAEICPLAVTGTKDAIDEFGNPVYQGIDTSFLVATLTAAIQEQQALITQLQADVAALKGTA